MEIKKLQIQNYKSLVNFELVAPNPFTVFIGPNASGKSNFFEALEFVNYNANGFNNIESLFGGNKNFRPLKYNSSPFSFKIKLQSFESSYEYLFEKKSSVTEIGNKIFMMWPISTMNNFRFPEERFSTFKGDKREYNQFYSNFSRLFPQNQKLVKININDDSKLNIDASNLEKVLKRILKDEGIKEELLEWLQLLVPEFDNIEVRSDNIAGTDTLLVYEKYTDKPFNKTLLSDGTFNILALLTAVFQSDEPQFLCIEEPENGLNPYVVKTLVDFFRTMCEEKGHFIWLNTHSPILVSELQPKEVVLIEKMKGETVAKQLKDKNLHGMKMDEAWLTNALGGGLPW